MHPYDYLFKIAVIGDMTVGKTAFVNKFVKNEFKSNHESTIGVEFGSSIISINNINYKFHIWDTAGQEKFMSLTQNYYRNVCGMIVMYDISNRMSFNHLKMWMRNVEYYCHENVSIVIIGTKVDLDKSHKRQVSYNEGLQFAQDNNALFFEISSKKNINIQNIFETLALKIHEKIKNKEIESVPDKGIKIGHHDKQILNKNKCCLIM